MLNMRSSSFREVSWSDVSVEIKKLAPDLYEAIEQLPIDKSYKLYEASYSYGEYIVDQNGHFKFPDSEGVLRTLSEEYFDKELVNQLSYGAPLVPLSIVLEGETHAFIEQDQLISTMFVARAGNMVALQSVLDLPSSSNIVDNWRITSGSRAPYMLVSISDKLKFKRLAKIFDLDMPPPRDQRDHWRLFKAIANHKNFPKPWHTRILFFGKKWAFEGNSLQSKNFRLALFKRAWESTKLVRNNFYTLDKKWEKSVGTIRNKKVDRYIINMARHIIDCAYGKIPTHQLANKNVSGPFEEIANIICELYGLKNYAPLILTPYYFNPSRDKDAYVSIQLPTTAILRKRTSRSHFLLTDFCEIMYVVNKFINDNNKDLSVKAPVLNIDHFKYQFYAANKGKNNEFLFAENAFEGNKMIDYWKRPGNDKIFPYNTFMRACVRISYTDDDI